MTYLDPSDPVNDLERLRSIGRYDLESEPARCRLHALARRAAEHFDLPIGLVSIVLDSAQYLAGMYGVEGWIAEADGTPIEWSFCANAVRSGLPYVVEDATVDPLQHDNPLVTIDGIRSYAGAPLRTANGEVIGAYCVLGLGPHHFSDEDIASLEAMAAEVMDEIESLSYSAAETP